MTDLVFGFGSRPCRTGQRRPVPRAPPGLHFQLTVALNTRSGVISALAAFGFVGTSIMRNRRNRLLGLLITPPLLTALQSDQVTLGVVMSSLSVGMVPLLVSMSNEYPGGRLPTKSKSNFFQST